MGSTWKRRGSGQTHGAGVQQRPSKTAGRGCAEAHRLKSPGAAALLAIGGLGAARLGALGGLPVAGEWGWQGSGRRDGQRLQGGGGARRPGGEPELEGLQRGLAVCRGHGARRARGRTGGRRPRARHPQFFSPEKKAPGPPSPDPGAQVSPSCSAGGAGGGRRLWVPRDAGTAAGCPAPAGVQRGLDPERGGQSPGWRGVGGWRGLQPHSRTRTALTRCSGSLLTATSRHGTGRAEGGASAGRGGAGLAGGRHPGTRSRPCPRSPTGVRPERRATLPPPPAPATYGAQGRRQTS